MVVEVTPISEAEPPPEGAAEVLALVPAEEVVDEAELLLLDELQANATKTATAIRTRRRR